MKFGYVIFWLLAFHAGAIASEGPISGGGGGVVVYQAQAIAQIMDDVSRRMDIARKYFPRPGDFIRSIEWMEWKDGTTVYRVRTSSGCTAEVETTAKDWTGMEYTTRWGELVCPESP